MASPKSQQGKKHRQGVRESEFPQTPFLLSQKSIPKTNILVGYDPAQVRFVEQLLNRTAEHKDKVGDEDVIGKDSLLLVDSSRNLDLSPQVKEKVGIWSLDPLHNGPAGVNALLRFSAQLLGLDKPDKTQVQLAADLLTKEDVGDVRAAIWKSVWILAGKELEPIKFWKDPWETPTGWLPSDTDPAYRLNTLYWHLFGFTFTIRDEEQAIRKSGAPLTPARIKKLKALKLDFHKVEATYRELSQWRIQKYDPYVCALKIRNIWA